MADHRFDPVDFGESMSVPFDVQPLIEARLIWLNERWMIESGLDPYDSMVRTEFSTKILTNFGVKSALVEKDNKTSSKSVDEHFLFADRYGGTDGAIHGGSGRCGSKDGFIAKGIGKTPLVCEHADINHKNGYLSVAEAIKEVVSSEIANRELPWGGIPIVAVIDAGFSFPSGSENEIRHAAIVVRPAFIRPAHFERSVFFGKGGTHGSEQFQDALRVKTAIQSVVVNPQIYPSLMEMFRRFAQQIGVARASRLWQGRFLSSNVSIDGALVDFGSFRSVPNWRRSAGLAGECFGAEISQLRHAFLSVASYFGKYSPDSLQNINLKEYLRQLYEVEQKYFIETCLKSLGVDLLEDKLLASELAQLISIYYQLQQTIKVGANVDDKYSWIYDIFIKESDNSYLASESERKIVKKIKEIIVAADSASTNVGISLKKAKYFFRPRPLLKYEIVDQETRSIESLVGKSDQKIDIAARSYIDRQISKNVLWSRLVPRRFDVLSVVSDIYSAIFLCEIKNGKSRAFWVRAAKMDQRLFLLGKKLIAAEVKYTLTSVTKSSVEFEVPIEQYKNGILKIGTDTFPIENSLVSLVDNFMKDEDVSKIVGYQESAFESRLSSVYGHAIRLLTSSNRREDTLKLVGTYLWPAVRLNQIEFLYNSKGMPIAFACWAFITSEVAETLINDGNYKLDISEWNEGDHLWLIDVVAPYGDVRNLCKKLKVMHFSKVTRIRGIRRYVNGRNERLIDLRINRKHISTELDTVR